MNSGARVSIPNNIRKTIQNIKEITGNHSEDEIYAMLKECSMDPNETAQKLLLQDPFHEVRRKRDRKKEIPIKESTEPRWKPGMQGRGNRGGRGPYTSRHNSHDGGSNRNAVSGKENEIIKVANESVIIPPATLDKKNKEKSMVATSSSNIAPEIPLSEKTSSVPDGNLSASDPILMPSPDSRIPVGTIKREWKPKPTNPIPIPSPIQVQVQAPETSDSIPVPVIPLDPLSTPESTILDSKETKLPEPESESHIPDTQHVIIPNHLHVPEAEKLGFRFGSFDFNSISLNEPVSDTCPLSEPSEKIIEEEHEVVNADNEDDNPDHSSEKDDVASHEPKGPKQEPSPPRQQHPVVSFGFMPPVIGTHIAPIENTESQNASRVPNFVVQQPFDPSSYYPHFYRSGNENDGRVSPFHPQGGPPKYNGNVTVLSSQSSQEVGNSLMSTPSPTQASGPIPVTAQQQPLPVFRQPPTGLHLPHYPPNYIPYAPYFSPFYLPPPPMHQFLGNGGFPQQGQSGNMYPGPPGKYPVQQYKPGGNIGNSGHGGVSGGYGGNGNSGSNEDIGGPQFKENNVYVTGQQSENPGVWIATPGREIPGSFYNLPSFTGIYHHHHPAPPVTTTSHHPLLHPPQTLPGGVDMAGPTSTMYQQQQQPPPPNWPNNY